MSIALFSGNRFEAAGVTTASSLAGSITAHASANTKGSYTELIASSSVHAHGILVIIGIASNGDYLIDIAIEGASSEQVIIPNIPFSSQNGVAIGHSFFIPIEIPKGSRISARAQSSAASSPVVRVQVQLIGSGYINPGSLSKVTNYGANTADSGGVSVDPGGSINTKGAYSQITASTTFDIKWIVILIGNGANTARTAYQWLLDIGIGAAAAEQILIPDLPLHVSTITDVMNPYSFSFPCSIPAGTRIAARAQCSGADATDRLFDIIILGVN